MEIAKHSAPHPYTLPSIVDFSTLMEIQPAIHHLLAASSQTVVVDAGAVERISTPGIQFLIASQKSAASGHKSFAIAQPSASFTQALEDLGLDTIFTPKGAS